MMQPCMHVFNVRQHTKNNMNIILGSSGLNQQILWFYCTLCGEYIWIDSIKLIPNWGNDTVVALKQQYKSTTKIHSTNNSQLLLYFCLLKHLVIEYLWNEIS